MAPARTQKRVSTSSRTTTSRRGPGRRTASTRAAKAPVRSTKRGSTAPTRAGATRARKATPRARLQRWVAPVLVSITIVLAAWTVYPVLRIQYQHERELQTLQAELDGLKRRNETLREQVDRLKTPEGVEEAARESLGMVKPGEQAYVVTGGTLGETSETVLADGEPEPPLWQQALDALFGL